LFKNGHVVPYWFENPENDVGMFFAFLRGKVRFISLSWLSSLNL